MHLGECTTSSILEASDLLPDSARAFRCRRCAQPQAGLTQENQASPDTQNYDGFSLAGRQNASNLYAVSACSLEAVSKRCQNLVDVVGLLNAGPKWVAFAYLQSFRTHHRHLPWVKAVSTVAECPFNNSKGCSKSQLVEIEYDRKDRSKKLGVNSEFTAPTNGYLPWAKAWKCLGTLFE